ncbi:MAG: replication factor C small subunit [Promethearchaeota archaeon]
MKLNEIIGQKPITDRLKRFLVERDLPHLLFAGPAGTGKTTAILAFAHELFGDQFSGNFLELNASVAPETPILIRENGKTERINFEILSKRYFKKDEKYAKPSNLDILSLDENYQVKFLPVSLISRHKVSKIAKIKYAGGEVKTSLNHSVIILDQKGNLTPKEVSDLEEGDLLITFREDIEGQEKIVLDFEEYEPQLFNKLQSGLVRNPKIKNTLKNSELDEELAWLLGTYLAEGCLRFRKNTSGGLVFDFGYPSEMNQVERVQTILEEKFNLESKTKLGRSGFDRARTSSIQVTVHNTQLARFFKNNFYNGSEKYTARYKRVPKFIYDSQYKWDFLKGYTNDATGQWGEYLRYSSSSEENLIDITWLGRISGLDTSCFNKETRITWKLPSFSYIKTDLLPAEPIINLCKENDESIDFNWRYLLRHQLYSKQSKRVSKKIVKKLLEKIREKIGRDKVEKLLKLVNSHLTVVLIKKIELTEYSDYLYDVAVPGSEMFWGGTAPILLHNSDERGIDVIRNRVKSFARTSPLGDAPFKIISLDEADSLTRDAQHALRRTMERYVSSCRFCLIVNYSSRIIEPIQSRCAIFRFPRLDQQQLKKRIQYIAQQEGVELSEDGVEAILYVSSGDMRRAINVLQAAAVTKKLVDADAVYSTTGKARPEEVREMISSSLNGDFLEAQNKLRNLLVWQGLSGSDIVRQIHSEVLKLGVDEKIKVQLVGLVGEAEFRLTEGADPEIQLSYVLANFALIGNPK